jgi:hypothetical protein
MPICTHRNLRVHLGLNLECIIVQVDNPRRTGGGVRLGPSSNSHFILFRKEKHGEC